MDLVNEIIPHNGKLKSLVKGTVYQVEYCTFRSKSDSELMYDNPKVQIFADPSQILTDRYGYMVRNRHLDKEKRVISDNIRRSLIVLRNSSDRVNAMIVGLPKVGIPEGPYFVVGTDKKLSLLEDNLSFTKEEALEVIVGDSVFYGKYIKESKENEYPIITVYNADGSRRMGFIMPPEHILADSKQRYSERKITIEIYENIKKGDRLIVRKFGKNSKNGVYTLIPVINLLEEDNAKTLSGEVLVTRITGYNKGDFIFDLPIIKKTQLKKGPILFGVGVIKRPESDPINFFYKPVWVRNAHEDLGKIVREAVIIEHLKKIILAEKVH